MSEKETKTFKIKWTKVLKKVSPYNIKKGILYLKALWSERILGKTYGAIPGR